MIRLRLLVLCVGLGLCAGCLLGNESKAPTWVLSPQETYSHSEYLTGLGQGQTRDQAEKRAYASVARVFTAHVQARSSDEETYSISQRNNQSSTRRSLQIDHMTRVTTDKVLENVQILESWFRQKDKQFFVLVGLNRKHAEKILLARLYEIDENVQEELKRGRSHIPKIHRIQGYKRVMALLGDRMPVNQDLRVIRITGEGLPATESLNAVRQEFLDFVASEVSISVSIQGESPEELERAIWEALKKEGLLAGTQSVQASPADLSITGIGRLWTVDLPDPLFRYVRWCGDIEIKEGESQRLLGVISQSGREGHITEDEARVRASRAMQEVVAKEVALTLTRSVFQEDSSPTAPAHIPKACPR